MTQPPVADIAARALGLLGAPAQVELVIDDLALARFAESRVTYQHAERRATLTAKLTRNGNVVWGSTGSTRPSAIVELRHRLEASAASLPVGAQETASVDVGEPHDTRTWFPATAERHAGGRLDLFATVRAALPDGVILGGSISDRQLLRTVATTEGIIRSDRRTLATVQLSARAGPAATHARVVHRDAAAVAPAAVADAMRPGLADLPPRNISPGAHRAVLSAQAFATLVATFAHITFGANDLRSGQSPLAGRLGELVASPKLTLTDDGSDPAGLPTTIDCEGVAKRPVPLLVAGRFVGFVHDARSALAVGARSTGHAVPTGWRFGTGPSPSHLLVEPGDARDTDLLETCDSGMYVQRVDYVRVVRARDGLVTGTTRDATLWVEGGQPIARLPQVRFTMRLIDVLNQLEAIGIERQRCDTVFMESVVAPAVVVRDFAVDAVVEA